MLEQQIGFCNTADGVRIAFSTIGSGPPLLYIPGWTSHLERDLEDNRNSEALNLLTKACTLVRLDKRGTGLSDRGVGNYTLESRVLDVEAVVDHLQLDRFAVFGISEGGPIAISYTVRHPSMVTRLALYGTYARGEALWGGKELQQAISSVVLAEWGLGSKLLAELFLGTDADPEIRDSWVAGQAPNATAEDAHAIITAAVDLDVSPILSEIKVPCLVVHARDDKVVPIECGRELAARIPGASFVSIDGPHSLLGHGRAEVVRHVFPFLLSDSLSPDATEARAFSGVNSSMRTILFTDLVGHTEMMSRLGDDKGREVLRDHEKITREVLAAHSGTEVKTMGDGFMASFGSVTKAVECAIALQRAFAEREGEPLSVRVGLNAGEPIEEDGDLFGATVILASRIAAKAEGGEILVADTVRGLCSGKGFVFANRGEFVAKGFEEAVRVYEVSWRE